MSILNDSDEEKVFTCDDPEPNAADRHEAIAKIAYHLWEHRGGVSTIEDKQADWRKAEKIYDGGLGVLDEPES